MARPRRTIDGKDIQEAIISVAYRQMAEKGAAALSLRSIARELGVTAPAIYNYYKRRDDLVTALIEESYNSLSDSQRFATAGQELIDLADQMEALSLAYRQWAVRYPQRYQLIFGTPISGYEAPEDTSVMAASWVLQPLVDVLQKLLQAGRLRTQNIAPTTPALRPMLAGWQAYIAQYKPDMLPNVEVLYLALVIWSRLHGLVILEIGGQLPSFFSDPGEIYRREIKTLRKNLVRE